MYFCLKKKDSNVPIPDKYMGKYIDWWFVKSELMALVDIDESDTEDDGGSNLLIYQIFIYLTFLIAIIKVCIFFKL